MSVDYDSQMATLKSSYIGNLEDFKKYYVLTHEFPNDQTYSNFFSNAKKNLQTNMKDLFVINNMIQNQIATMKSQSDTINEKIALAKQEEQILVQKLNAANADQGAAKTMIYDYKNRYVVQYIANVTLFFGTIITATILVKTYRIKSSQ